MSAHRRSDAAAGLAIVGSLGVIFTGHALAGGFAMAPALCMALAVSAIAAVVLAITPDSGLILSDRVLWLAGLGFLAPLGVALIQSCMAGFDREYALLALIRLYGVAALFVVGCTIGWSHRHLLYFQLALAGAILVFSAVCLVQFQLTPPHLVPGFQTVERLAGAFGSPNSAGLMFALSAVSCVSIVLDRVRDGERRGRPRLGQILLWLAVGAAALSVIDLGLTRSRSGLILCVVAVAIQLSFAARTAKSLLYLAPLVVVAMVVLWVTISFRLVSAGGDLAFRLGIYRAHLGMVFDRPLLGHGFGSFVELNRRLGDEATFGSLFNIGAMHEVYLQWLEQAGVVALAGMALAVLIILGAIGAQAWRRGRSGRHWLAGSLMLALVAFGQGLLDLGLEHYSIVLTLALLLGTGFGVRLRRGRRKANGSPLTSAAQTLIGSY